MTSAKILITSKHYCEKSIRRKPVKECYCHFQVQKALEKSNKQCLPTSISYSDNYPIDFDRKTEQQSDKLPICSETLKRLNQIDYVPTSVFLRKAKSRVPNPLITSSLPTSNTTRRLLELHKSTDVDDLNHFRDATTDMTKNEYENKNSSNLNVLKLSRSYGDLSSVRKVVSSEKTSRGCTNEPAQIESTVRKTVSSKEDCCINTRKSNKLRKSSKNTKRKQTATHKFEDNAYQGSLHELQKFRVQNYFDTHGSSHTLLSESSGSLLQCLLNERLFPVPTKKIHKSDLVVTMPPCATKQGTRIHYFPRYVVSQNKNVSNANKNKKLLCGSCPLTGHAIDLGVLKKQPITDSISLRYQERLP